MTRKKRSAPGLMRFGKSAAGPMVIMRSTGAKLAKSILAARTNRAAELLKKRGGLDLLSQRFQIGLCACRTAMRIAH